MNIQMDETKPAHAEVKNFTPFSVAPWVPLIGLLLMSVLTAILLVNVVNIKNQSTFAMLIACLTWSISVLFFAGSISITFVSAFRVILRESQSPKPLIAGIALFIAAGVITSVFLPGKAQGLPFNKNLLGGVYDFAPSAELFVDAVQLLGTLGLVALAIAVSLILSRARNISADRNESVAKRVATLSRDQDIIRKLLYLGSVALIAGALQASALYSWGSTIHLPAGRVIAGVVNYDEAPQPADIPQSMGAFNGAFYSIFLAVIFVPAFLQLREIANRLIGEENPDATETERNAWFVSHALDYSVPRQLLSALAILSPLLVGGPLTSLLETLTGK